MPLYRPTELKKFLEEIGAAPRRSLSQNFLIDGNIIRKTVMTAEVQPGDTVLEIGPGPGVLTEALLLAGAHVVAIEKDHRFATALTRLQTPDGRLKVLEEDALTIDLKNLRKELGGQRAKLIANLPYSITTPLITRYAPLFHLLERIVVCVQDEVAQRLTAPPGPLIGSITHFVGYYGKPSYAFRIGRDCFYPAPKVDSAVVSLVLCKREENEKKELFFDLVRTSFSQRRKMLRKTLSTKWNSASITQFLDESGLPVTARPEELSLEDWLKLSKKLSQKTLDS